MISPSIFGSAPGTLIQLPSSPVFTGMQPKGIKYSPIFNGFEYAVAANYASNTISVYSVDQITGAFTEISSSPFATKAGPFGVSFSPILNDSLYILISNDGTNDVTVYSINAQTGALTEIAGSPFSTFGSNPGATKYSPIFNGAVYAAVANRGSNDISIFSVNQTTGSLTEIAGSPFAAGTGTIDVLYSPIINGNLYLAATNLLSANVSVYSVNPETGALAQVPGSPFATTGAESFALAYSPVISGSLYAAITNYDKDTISVYSVNPTTGAFTEIPESPFASAPHPLAIYYFSLYGSLFVGVTNDASNGVSVYSVNQSTGALTQVFGSPFASGDVPQGLAFSPVLNGSLYLANTNLISDTISIYRVTSPAISPIAFAITTKYCT